MKALPWAGVDTQYPSFHLPLSPLLLFTLCLAISSTSYAQDAQRPVACLGRISPKGEVIHLSIPASSYPGYSPIAQLLVEEGSSVTNNQVLAVLENKPRLEAQWQAAKALANVAEARLYQVRTGAKASEIAAQEADIERLAAELHVAQLQFNRRRQLREQNAISPAEFDEVQATLNVAEKRLEAARQQLLSLREPGPAELALAEADWQAALAEADYRKAEMEQAILRSPITGVVLQIHTRPGEREGPHGVMDLGDTRTLYALAEVHETDIHRVQLGQPAEISIAALPDKFQGVVEHIGLQVSRNSLFSNDPTAATDARVIPVKIRIHDATAATGFVNARARILIRP